MKMVYSYNYYDCDNFYHASFVADFYGQFHRRCYKKMVHAFSCAPSTYGAL